MRDVSQYFEIIEKAIEYSPATEVELEILRFGATSGLIEGVVYFAEDARLEFSELVVLEKRHPTKQEYRYQFVQGGVAIFRYDNASHHEQIATHPHHKHVGAKVLPAFEPEFQQVLDEALALLSGEASDTGHAGKKRRQRRPRKS